LPNFLLRSIFRHRDRSFLDFVAQVGPAFLAAKVISPRTSTNRMSFAALRKSSGAFAA
jgi:hypothetical protein